MIEPGDEAPDFEPSDQDGRAVRPSGLRGRQVVARRRTGAAAARRVKDPFAEPLFCGGLTCVLICAYDW
jgi:hypothetical protein